MVRPPVRQLPLSFHHDPASARDDLIVSDRLSAAISIVDRWPDWPSPVVVLTGPAGSGKSHLTAIWARKAGAEPITLHDDAAIVAASAGPVYCEDIDRAGFDETRLFHVINAVRSEKTALLLTSRLWPAAWTVTLPDLASRLKAATVVEIGEPDDALLTQVLVKLFADRQLTIDSRVAAFLVSRMERSLAAAQLVVDRIDHLALARGTRITRALAGEALAGLWNNRESD